MSTRCQFAIFHEGVALPKKMTEAFIRKNATALCYRHSDGWYDTVTVKGGKIPKGSEVK